MSVPKPQQDAGAGKQGQWSADKAEHHHDPRQQSRPPHQVTQKDAVAKACAELGTEHRGLVMHGEQATADVHQA